MIPERMKSFQIGTQDFSLEEYQAQPKNFPEHKFNCDDYLYLGSYENCDLYFYCAKTMDEYPSTAIYVWGPEDSEYSSGTHFMNRKVAEHMPPYRELFFRLLRTGFATDKMKLHWVKDAFEREVTLSHQQSNKVGKP